MSTIAAGLTSTNALVNTGDTSGQLVFQTNGTTTAMTIDTSQKVGIGTNSPSSLLHVYSSTTTAVSKTEVNTSVGNVARLELKSPVADYGWYVADNANALVLYDYNASAARMVIDSSGNVGIGTNSPSYKLDVVGATGAIRVQPSTNTNSAYSVFQNTGNILYFGVDNSSGTDFGAAYSASIATTGAYPLTFRVNNSERMRIESSGNVLIGTTTAQGRMTVVGSSGSVALYTSMNTADGSGLYNVNANSGSYFTIQSNGSNGYGVSGWAYSTVFESVPASTGGLVLSSYTGNMIFQVGTGRTERMRIDSSGNVGIGTASPTVKLSIYNSTTDTDVLTISNPSTNADAQQHYVGMIFGDNAQGNGGGNSSAIRSYSNLYATYGSTLKFYTTANTGLGLVERMRIDSSGSLLVGATSYPVTNRTNGFSWVSGGYLQIRGPGSQSQWAINSTSGVIVYFYSDNGSGNVYAGAISVNGNTTSYTSVSDYRLKENIQPMTGALEKVAKLNPVTFNFKDSGQKSQGFIAHELQEVVPDCVTGEKDAVDEEGKPIYQGIDTSFLVATLTKAIQEQQSIINELKSRIETLENK